MSTFPFRMPKGLKTVAAAQAERAGVSMNQYLLSIVATRVGVQSKAELYFAIRTAHAVLRRAKEILARAGVGRTPEAGDELPSDLATQLGAEGPSA